MCTPPRGTLEGSSSPRGPTDYHRRLGSTHTKCSSSSSTRSAPHGPDDPSHRDGVGVCAITPPPGTAAQTPSTACARCQRTGCAQKLPFLLARRPHNGLEGYTGSPEGAAQPPNRRALRWRIPKKPTNSPELGQEQWAQRGTPSKARRTPRSLIYGRWRSARGDPGLLL
jgi:hypothetical protein